MKKDQKQNPVKRVYVKKSAKWTKKEAITEPPVSDPKKDNEIELLAAIISIFDNWDHEQKQRNLKYLASRYYDFM